MVQEEELAGPVGDVIEGGDAVLGESESPGAEIDVVAKLAVVLEDPFERDSACGGHGIVGGDVDPAAGRELPLGAQEALVEALEVADETVLASVRGDAAESEEIDHIRWS